MASSRLTGINYMGLNELINMIYNFMTFCLKYYWLAFNLCFPENLSSYAMTYNKLIKYTSVL